MATARRSRSAPWVTGLLVSLALSASAAPAPTPVPAAEHADVRGYIARTWDALTRSLESCEVFADPKVAGRAVLYLPRELPEPAIVQRLRQKCPKVEIHRLPEELTGAGQVDVRALETQGLLYLEHPYVVPGGMFNEMYGWDSYFIIRGLLRDGRRELAQGMVRNFFFELQHYGALLNANRTYFLSRSQPPFLTSMVMEIHRTLPEDEGRAWLTEAWPFLVRDHALWVGEAHLAGDTGLSRYFDFNEGPVPELAVDQARYYRDVVSYFTRHPEEGRPFLREVDRDAVSPSTTAPVFLTQVCQRDPGATTCTTQGAVTLTEDFYRGDRAMRESGFDISFRFGPFSARTHHYAAVDLNSLLYKAETDLERISTLLGRDTEARVWHERATKRRALVDRYLWDAERGMYFDYDVEKRQRSTYEYATTFYPLWAGLASPEQARAVAAHLPDFERAGGLAMSRERTSAQWDLPYGWAPVQLLAVEGLRRHGHDTDADRLSRKFLDMVAENFHREGNLREKYDVVKRTTEVQVTAGYAHNVIGFGWTNGVFLELWHGLRREPTPPARPASPSPRPPAQ
ncbi:trehalase family glycosidase [Cystobacter fuscus]|uniref:trehalase family glycosidase n=1 Tax=Cystobacter fuscus TaxID=43 RepID=UPI002B2EF2FF|nr:trehalase [Cystobacter fuscus]